LPVFYQELFINLVEFFVIIDIVVICGIIIYSLMYLVDLIKWGKVEASIYFKRNSVPIILFLILISIIIQFLFFSASLINFDGYNCTDISIRYNHININIEKEEEKDSILELINNRKINRVLFEDGSSNVKDTIFIDFMIFRENDAKHVHLTVKKDAIRIYESANTSFIYKFDKEELDLYEKILEWMSSVDKLP